MENTLFLLFFWTGPIGIGIFLVCLGTMIWLLSRADEIGKRSRAMMKDKGLDKK
jgi:TM2 domain-containing membrane protein YozV